MMDQEIAHPLRNDLRVLRRFLCRIPLRERRDRPAVPTADQVAATPVGCAHDTSDTPDAGIAGILVERVVVGGKIVDVEDRECDLVRIALRQQPVAQQQLLEIGARVQARQPVLPQPRRQAGRRLPWSSATRHYMSGFCRQLRLCDR